MAFTGHELRNRLAALHLAVEKLRYELVGHDLSQRQEKAIKHIAQSITSLEATAQKYLHLARLNDPGYCMKKVAVDPAKDIVARWRLLNSELLEHSGQTLLPESVQPGILVWADPEMLYSVFDNLLGNAIKYGKAGGLIAIRILDRGSSIAIEIWNDGVGIPPEKLESIFERYTREDAKSEAKGYGLGLFLAKMIVEAHGGRIWADSRLGEWASFTFTLPQRRY